MRRIGIFLLRVAFASAAALGAVAGRRRALAVGFVKRMVWLGLTAVCGVTALLSLAWMLLAGLYDPTGRRAWSIAEGFDQTANAALGGDEDMTLSAHAGYRLQDPIPPRWATWLCAALDRIDPGHCEKSRDAFLAECPRKSP